MEGLVVGKDISVAHLIGAMKTLLRGIFASGQRMQADNPFKGTLSRIENDRIKSVDKPPEYRGY